jgi:hypothetical protein
VDIVSREDAKEPFILPGEDADSSLERMFTAGGVR